MITDHDLVLHVGMPRASHILGPAMRRLRPQLRAHGVAFLEGWQLDGLPHASDWNRDRLTRRKPTAEFRREIRALVSAEQQRSGSLWRRRVPIVIAGDQLLGHGDIGRRDAQQLRPYASCAVSQVIAAVGARNVQIVLHTHRQDRLLELAYLSSLRSGQNLTIEQYFPDPFAPVLDYPDLLTRLRTVPYVAEVVVQPVELADAGVHAFVNEMLGVLGLRDALDLYTIGADLLPHPPVYSARGAALARALNPLVQGAEFTLIQEFLTKNHSAPAEYGPTDIFTQDDRAMILDRYAASNALLFRDEMPQLPSHSYRGDVDTFALGNVLRQPRPVTRTITSRLTVAAAVRTNRASVAVMRNRRQLRRRLPFVQRRLEPLRKRLGSLI